MHIFFSQTESLNLIKQPLISTIHDDSFEYPGYKKVTCQLQLLVTGNNAGAYQFQVKVTSTEDEKITVKALAPILDLSKKLFKLGKTFFDKNFL